MLKELDVYRAEADRLRAAEAKHAAEMSHIVKALTQSSRILFVSTSTAMGDMFFMIFSWYVQTHSSKYLMHPQQISSNHIADQTRFACN